MDAAGPCYAWPKTLIVPPRPPKLVYLDLNHWIELDKALAGHPDGDRFRGALTACQDAVDRGTAIFPISDTIFFEASKIRQYRQRRELREVIERISSFLVVACRSLVSAHEIEAMLTRLVGPNPRPVNMLSYVDWGVARAFGKVGGFRVRRVEDGADVTDEARRAYRDGPEAFDRRLFEAEREVNRRTLDGPTPDEEPELRKSGWQPYGGFEVMRRRAEQEIEQVRRFDADSKWRRGRIRDVVAAREVMIEINEMLFESITDRGATLERLFPKPEDARRNFDSMPSFDVAVTLKTEYHRDPSHHWTTNDIHDIDALGSTLPYCDIVVTDKAVASHAVRTGLADRLGTVVLSRLDDLVQHLP